MNSELFSQLGQVLLSSLWQGAIFGAVLMILLAFVRQVKWRYALACLTLFSMLGWFVVSAVNLFVSPKAVSLVQNPVVENVAVPTLEIITGSAVTPGQVPEAIWDTKQTNVTPVKSMPVARDTHTSFFRFDLQKFLPYVSLLWMIGVALLSVRLLISVYLLRRYKKESFELSEFWIQERLQTLAQRMNLKQHVKLLQTNMLTTPAVMGVIKPILLMPSSLVSGLSVQQLDMLLAHELAHIKRHDCLVNILQMLAETLLFYHPVVWWVSRVIRQERENCCDDMALQFTGQSALEYAEVLLRLEKSRQGLALAATNGSLLRRVERLLNAPKAGVSVGSSLAALLLVACLSLTFVVNAVNAQPIQVSKVPYVFNAGVAVDPTNPARIAVSVNQSSHHACIEFPGCALKSLIYTSKDGGSQWQEQKPSSASFLQPIFSAEGDFYTATNTNSIETGLNYKDELTRITMADAELRVEESDNGREFFGAVLTSSVALDDSTGDFYLSYLSWEDATGDLLMGQPELRKSTDGGKTWSAPLGVLEKPVLEVTKGYPLKTHILLGESGNLAFIWAQIDISNVTEVTLDDSLFSYPPPFSLWIVTSSDGGQTFAEPRQISAMGENTSWGEIATAYENGVYYVLSKQVSMLDGRLGLVLHYSTDNGKTWKLARVSKGLKLYTTFPYEVMPGLSVSPDGTVDVVFYGHTNAPDCISLPSLYVQNWTDRCDYNVYHTFSKDTGATPKTFSQPQQLNDEPIVGSQFVRLYGHTTPGDFISIASTNDAAYPVWIGNREGVEGTQAYMMKIER
jgi:beta-lactamase regulating signal transducer with metallopeptidase domain